MSDKSASMYTLMSRSAVAYQSLYLANLLLLPILSFIVLICFLKSNQSSEVKISRFSRIHLIRAMQLSVAVGIFLIVIPLIVLFASSQFNTSLMVLLVYFVTIHAGFVLIGMLNLSRAMANKLPLF